MRTFIFDFDGVLADSFQPLYMLNKEAFSFIGIDFLENDYKNLFKDNIHFGFKSFIKNQEDYPKFLEFKKRNFGKYYSSVKLFPEVPDFLPKIKGNRAIVSATLSRFISPLLAKSDLEKLFGLILGTQDHTKTESFKEILKKFNALSGETFFVSDTSGDIRSAKSFGFRTVGVTWGFHSEEELSSSGPDNIVRDFKGLCSYLTKAGF
jgi:phosphoglycolate phosphatase